jgi:DNA-binding transcriptional LysR family regulator
MQQEARFSASVGAQLIVPAEPLAVQQQIAVLEAATGVELDRAVTCDNIQMIKSLVLEGVGIGVLTSLDVVTEVETDRLRFTRISDPVLRPMTLALCTASTRTLSYAAGVCLREMENDFAQLGYFPPD